MDRRWESIAGIGIVFPKLFPDAQESEARFFKELSMILIDPFFTVIELSYIADERMRRQAAEQIARSGMEVIFNGGDAFRQLKIDLSALDEGVRLESVEKARMLVDQCCDINAKILHIVTGKYTCDEEVAPMTRQLVKSIEEICTYAGARKEDLMVSLETGDRYADRHYLMGPTNEAVGVIEEVGLRHGNFGLLLDQSHLPVMGEEPRKALYLGREHLTHVHLGNSYVKDPGKSYFGDKHLPFGVPDSAVGCEELTVFLRALFEFGFFDKPVSTRKPVLTFEVGAFSGEPAEVVLANIKRMFFEAWDRV